MNLKVLQEDKNMLKVEVGGETHTLTQLIAKIAWEENGEAAAVREHPFMIEPFILVKGTNPKKILEKAATRIIEQCDELKEEFSRALKK